MAYPELYKDVTHNSAKEFLLDLGTRKEFKTLIPTDKDNNTILEKAVNLGVIVGCNKIINDGRAFFPCDARVVSNGENIFPVIDGLRLHGGQLFVENFMNPDNPYSRLLLNWQTGTGKSIAVISIAQRYINQFRSRISFNPINHPSVFILGFTRNIIQAEMIKRPELGLVTYEETAELKRLRILAFRSGSSTSPETRHFGGFLGVLKRRFTDRSRGGYYNFYGYKEFVNRLFTITRKGTEHEFDTQVLFKRNINSEQEEYSTFVKSIRNAETNGLIKISHELLIQIKGGLIIADEVHNIYNTQERNNYGIAIQYILDYFPPKSAPRALFMSATPITGNAGEVVDLLNLLIPSNHLPNNRPIHRNDLFTRPTATDTGNYLPGALDTIATLAAGRVSFLLDAESASYPERIFEGVTLKYGGVEIPYLKFIPCKMSPLHARTLEANNKQPEGSRVTIAANAYTLYDMVFPNPSFDHTQCTDLNATGLYISNDTATRLIGASAEWKTSLGVILNGVNQALNVPFTIGGDFLSLSSGTTPGIANYSAKFAQVATDVLKIISDGVGKILIYHNRVKMAGVLLIQEVLQSNGLINEYDSITPSTVCTVCCTLKKYHKDKDASHQFLAARYCIINSDIDRGYMDRSIARFNSVSNNNGYEIRVLVGSKIITEGLNFTAVRYELITSLPSDIPTLIQVFGRVVRKNSHITLPPDQRNVKIRLYISTAYMEGGLQPELDRYGEKMKEFEKIQQGEKAIRRYAIDGFTNYKRNQSITATLEALPGKPPVVPEDIVGLNTTTFEAYGYGDREINMLTSAIKALFYARPVWTYDTLWEAVRVPGLIGGIECNTLLFDEGNFALALRELCVLPEIIKSKNKKSLNNLGIISSPHVHIWGEPKRIISIPSDNLVYYVLTPLDSNGMPVIDIESYLRDFNPPKSIRIRIADYLRGSRAKRNFQLRLQKFDINFSNHNIPIQKALTQFDYSFHYSLLTLLVEGATINAKNRDEWASNAYSKQTPATSLNRLIELYKYYHILITVGDIRNSVTSSRLLTTEKDYKSLDADKPIGYITDNTIKLYINREWRELSHMALGYGIRNVENNIVIGYIESGGIDLKFKLRSPLHKLERENVPDIRSVARGAVCETRSRKELTKVACDIKAITEDKCANISSSNICDIICDKLLELEGISRNNINGMKDGIRWFYLFNERLPVITLKNK